jgi:predicted amidohydrolase
MFMIGVNRVGTDGNGIYYSSMSCIINPYGELESPIFNDGALDIFEVDTKIVDQYRKSFPTLKDRKNFNGIQ